MVETWLMAPLQNFHNFVANTYVPELNLTEKDVLDYLNLILDPYFAYNSLNNYNIIDYDKIIYIELEFASNEEISKLITQVKEKIKESYIYKHKYLKRISDFIPYDKVNKFFDDTLTEMYEFPIKFR